MIVSWGIRRLGLLVVVAALLFSSTSRAQVVPEENKGMDQGNYNIHQTVEFGYRGNWVKGNQETYDTFVDLGSGLRLINYTVGMRSINHQGILFDNLNFSNFGYGGDPDNVSRLRIEKNKWYDFSAGVPPPQEFLGLQPAGKSVNLSPVRDGKPRVIKPRGVSRVCH